MRTAEPRRFDIFDTAAPTITFSPAAPANIVQGTSPAGAVVPYSAGAQRRRRRAARHQRGRRLHARTASRCRRRRRPRSSPTGRRRLPAPSTDSHGNTATTSFTIVVVDTVAPVVTVPAKVTLQATSPAGATYSFSATAVDNVDGAVTAACTPASGSTFAIGSTTVTCTATDNAGNTGSGSFVVTVVDTVEPCWWCRRTSSTLVTPGWHDGVGHLHGVRDGSRPERHGDLFVGGGKRQRIPGDAVVPGRDDDR